MPAESSPSICPRLHPPLPRCRNLRDAQAAVLTEPCDTAQLHREVTIKALTCRGSSPASDQRRGPPSVYPAGVLHQRPLPCGKPLAIGLSPPPSAAPTLAPVAIAGSTAGYLHAGT